MDHFVVINSWANEYECGVTILGVAHSLEEAKSIFDSCVGDEKTYAEEHGYFIYDDSDVDFDAGEEGYYAKAHTRVYIERVGGLI